MIKKLAILPLLLILAVFLSKEVYAKIWTKDLVDTVTLDSGYKFQICTIDLKYDFNAVKDAGFLSEQEKTFEANPDAYPCNKQSMQDVLLANITLNFSKTNWNGESAPEKLLLIQDGLYSVSAYGSILSDETTKAPISDISPVDWFSTLPAGIRAIRGTNLINTDPNAPENQKTLENSGFLVLHDPSTGKFAGALFMINNTTYKVSNIVSQVTESTTLVDYTSSDEMSNTSDETSDWKTFTSAPGGYSLKYPPNYVLNEGKIVGVDGVVSNAPSFIQLISPPIPNTNGNFTLSVNYLTTTSTLEEFVNKNSTCTEITANKGKQYTLSDNPSLAFINTPCGPRGSDEIYTVKNGMGYILKIESTVDETTAKTYYQPIFDTFKFAN